MDASRWQRVKEIFSAALDHEHAERAAFVATQCGSDCELAEEVRSLLRSHDATGDFIEKPAVLQAGLEPEPAPSWIGRRVGAYRIVAEIGRGGMSEVFKAVRADDEFHKEVAVKVLRPGYDTRSLLQRFRAEKQILASLDHPNIARILDGGSTEDGQPYLVMDYIHGLPIDEYCHERGLGVDERLELFEALCSAVQYVHQRLMVHGDLKCSNVLVTEDGSVRLLDFGVARLLNAGPGGSASGEVGLIGMTPEYASPEQIRGAVVTTSSDVYSLGVMLYRLLTGSLPHDGSGLLPHELTQQVCEAEPRLPSEAARSCGDRVLARQWKQLLGDLDAVILLALRKDPVERYSSVERFNEDLRSHRQGLPVWPLKSGLSYRARKFCSRHRAGVTGAALFVLALIGGLVASGWQAHIARQERARAERHFDEVRKLAQTFMFDVHQSIQNLPGATSARHMLVVNSLKYLDALAAESSGDPSLQRDLAMAYEKVGDVQGGYRSANLGDFDGAIASYRKALQIRVGLLPVQESDLDLRRELLTNYGKLGETLLGTHDQRAAIASTREALRYAEQLAATPGSNTNDQRNLGNVYLTLGWQLAKSDEVERGLLLMNQGTAVYETLIDADAHDVRSRHNAAVAYGRMGEILIGAHRYPEALRMHRRQYDFAHLLSAEFPRNADLQTIESYALLGIGTVLFRQGSFQDALEKQLQASRTLRALFDADPKDEEARFNAAFALGEIGESLIALGQLERAEHNLQDALAIIEPSGALGDPGLNGTKVMQSVDYYRLGRIHARRSADPQATARQRAGSCSQARRWFEQSSPVMEAAIREGQWPLQEPESVAQIEKHLNRCPAPRLG